MDQAPENDAAPIALSIIVPCHNEGGSLPLLLPRLLAAAEQAETRPFEIILVNDGSTDGSWGVIEDAVAKSPPIRAVNLARRYGQQIALSAGLSIARGQRIFIIDADLQDPPELLSEMMRLMDEGADVVYGQRRSREGESSFKRMTASLFYRLMQSIGDHPIPRDTGDFRLINRRVLNILHRMPERQRYLRGMIAWVGLKQIAIAYDRSARADGETHYSLQRMLNLAMDGITGFSAAPLRLSLWLSLGCGALAIFCLLYVGFSWLFLGTVQGWTSLASMMLFFFGLQFFSIGMIGEYVGRIYLESKQRPLFIIDETIGDERQVG